MISIEEIRKEIEKEVEILANKLKKDKRYNNFSDEELREEAECIHAWKSLNYIK